MATVKAVWGWAVLCYPGPRAITRTHEVDYIKIHGPLEAAV